MAPHKFRASQIVPRITNIMRKKYRLDLFIIAIFPFLIINVCLLINIPLLECFLQQSQAFSLESLKAGQYDLKSKSQLVEHFTIDYD